MGDRTRENNHMWTGSNATYSAMHQRVRAIRGNARCYDCQICGKAATNWAYDHRDSDARTEVIGPSLLEYSVDVQHYIPLCRPCHLNFDTEHGYATRGTCRNGHDCATYMTRVGKSQVRRCRRCHADRVAAWSRKRPR